MKRIMIFTAVVALAIPLLSGCATTIVRVYHPSSRLRTVYPATLMDAACMEMAVNGMSYDRGGPRVDLGPLKILLGIGVMIDMPISIVTDTVLLPNDIMMGRL